MVSYSCFFETQRSVWNSQFIHQFIILPVYRYVCDRCLMQILTCCMLRIERVEILWAFRLKLTWFFCLLSRISLSQFIFMLGLFLGSRQSVSLPCLCAAGWWVAHGLPACWLCPGMWSTGETTPPCYWSMWILFSSIGKLTFFWEFNVTFPF